MAKSPYYNSIRAEVARIGRIGTDPRHVEAYMRLDRRGLDALSRSEFQTEVRFACEAIDLDPKQAEALARSYGL